jgi:hypothetical protein
VERKAGGLRIGRASELGASDDEDDRSHERAQTGIIGGSPTCYTSPSRTCAPSC